MPVRNHIGIKRRAGYFSRRPTEFLWGYARNARLGGGGGGETEPQALLDLGQQLLDPTHALDQVVIAQRVGQPHKA